MFERLKKFKWQFLASLFLLTSFVWYVVYREDRHGILTVAFLDVGQGDSIYIESPNGNQILLDGGPDRKILKSLAKVMPFYDRTIDLLALSHPHFDHFGGFLSVVPRYTVGGLVSSGMIHDTPEFSVLQKILKEKNIKTITLRRGSQIDMGGGVALEVLLPDRDVANAKPHDGMLVVKLTYGKTSVLLTGDMEENLENYLVLIDGARDGGDPPPPAGEFGELKSQVLKIGHHGSRTSTSRDFLGYVSPIYAVISSGAGNSYGHPHRETLDILDKFGIKALRTDADGTIIFKTNGEELTVSRP